MKLPDDVIEELKTIYADKVLSADNFNEKLGIVSTEYGVSKKSLSKVVASYYKQTQRSLMREVAELQELLQ